MKTLRHKALLIPAIFVLIVALTPSIAEAGSLPKSIDGYAKCMAAPLRKYSKAVNALRGLVTTYVGNHGVGPLQTMDYNLGGYAITIENCETLAPTLWIAYYTQELGPLIRSLGETIYEITTPSVGSTVKEINLAAAKEKNVNSDLELLDKKIKAWENAHP
jgi:hypothetical protein